MWAFIPYFAFTVTIIILSIVVHISIRGDHTLLQHSFILFCICMVVWTFADLNIHTARDGCSCAYWNNISIGCWLVFPGLLLLFVSVLTKRIQTASVLLLSVICGSSAIIYILLNIVFEKVYHSSFVRTPIGWGRFEEPTAAMWIFSGYQFVLLFISIFLVWDWGRKSFLKTVKIQSRALVAFAALALALGSITDIILPSMGLSVPPFASFMAIIWFIGVWFAISKYNLFNLSPEMAAGKILSRVQDMIFLIDRYWLVIQTNEITAGITGFTPSEVEGKSFFDFLPLTREQVIMDQTIQTEVYGPNGKEIPVNMTITRYLNHAGDLTGYIAVLQDIRKSKSLESEISERIRTEGILLERTIALKNLLDNTGQGFLYLGDNLIIRNEYSKKCEELLGTPDVAGKNFVELFFNDAGIEYIKEILDDIFKESRLWKLEILLPLMPKEIRVKDNTIKLEYKIIEDRLINQDKLLMVILTDITEKKELESQMISDKRRLEMVVGVLANSDDFIECVEDYYFLIDKKIPDILSSQQPAQDKMYSIFSEIHTFKSSFMRFNLINAEKSLNGLEDIISEMIRLKTDSLDAMQSVLNEKDLKISLELDLDILRQTIGKDIFSIHNIVTIDRSKLYEFERSALSLIKTDRLDEFIDMFHALYCKSLKQQIIEYIPYTMRLAGSMNKSIQDIQVDGDDIYIDSRIYKKLFRVLIHIFRNIATHGIETADERIRVGKPPKGTIMCNIIKMDNEFRIEIADNGKGINPLEVRKNIIEFNLLKVDDLNKLRDDEVIQYIFNPGFSTCANPDSTSGRGMGLSSVREIVLGLGGNIKVYSNKGIRTRFDITLPIIMPANRQKG